MTDKTHDVYEVTSIGEEIVGSREGEDLDSFLADRVKALQDVETLYQNISNNLAIMNA